jgi:RNA polymerase sigma factor (sigma-70 family)
MSTYPLLPQGPVRRGADELSDSRLLQRFIAKQDPEAFETLLRRHGPLVLGVCRRVLHNEHAAEDAFQATFLVLARKAAFIAKPELLANWLYGVAYRTALKAKVQAARRRAHESRAASARAADPLDEVIRRDLGRVVGAALACLPEKYRAPLVLCYLEGKTNGQAAHQLGWPLGSMSARLARGRELLRRRLTGGNPFAGQSNQPSGSKKIICRRPGRQ